MPTQRRCVDYVVSIVNFFGVVYMLHFMYKVRKFLFIKEANDLNRQLNEAVTVYLDIKA